jgi:hypothetical protein
VRHCRARESATSADQSLHKPRAAGRHGSVHQEHVPSQGGDPTNCLFHLAAAEQDLDGGREGEGVRHRKITQVYEGSVCSGHSSDTPVLKAANKAQIVSSIFGARTERRSDCALALRHALARSCRRSC